MSFPKIQYTQQAKIKLKHNAFFSMKAVLFFATRYKIPLDFFCHSRRGRKEIEGSDNIMTRLYSKRDLVTRKFLLGTSKKAE